MDNSNNSKAESDSIATLPFVRELPDYMHRPLANMLVDVAQRRFFDNGEVIIREKEIGGALGYILTAGTVCVEREGKEPVRVSAPALLGEMHQFNPNAERSATVSARGQVTVLAFSWHELYQRVRAIFPEEDQHLLLESLERQVEQRLDEVGLLSLPVFQAVAPPCRARLCLMMVWLGRPKFLEAGELLYEQGTLRGNTGFLLQRGRLGVSDTPRHDAPAVLGVQPDFDPVQRWPHSMKALTQVEVLVFNWIDLLRRLEKRQEAAEHAELLTALRDYASAAG